MSEERDLNHPGKTPEEGEQQAPQDPDAQPAGGGGDAGSEATGSGPSGGAPADTSGGSTGSEATGSGPSGGA